jgi:hypothetical protein
MSQEVKDEHLTPDPERRLTRQCVDSQSVQQEEHHLGPLKGIVHLISISNYRLRDGGRQQFRSFIPHSLFPHTSVIAPRLARGLTVYTVPRRIPKLGDCCYQFINFRGLKYDFFSTVTGDCTI